MKFLSNNPAFDFLKDPKEDIYSIPEDLIDSEKQNLLVSSFVQ
jgi:hypothetical protein